MSDYQKIQEIARASLMADFFAVRIEEEGLYPKLQELVAKIKLKTAPPALTRLQNIAASSPDPNTFIDGIKERDLFPSMRDILTKIKVG